MSRLTSAPFPRNPSQVSSGPCPKVPRGGTLKVSCVIKEVVVYHCFHTLQQIVPSSNLSWVSKITPDHLYLGQMNMGGRSEGPPFVRLVFGNDKCLSDSCTRRKESVPYHPVRGLGSRLYGRFPAGTFARKDSYCHSPDVTFEEASP